jgi:hypothetical protein
MPILGNIAMDVRDYDNYEFFGDKASKDSVCGTLLSPTGNSKFGYGFAAGVESIGKTCAITKNIGSFILRIDGKPAIKGFADAVGIDKDSLVEMKNIAYVNYYNMLGSREMVNGREYIHPSITVTNPELENLIITGFPFNKVPAKAEIFRCNQKRLLESAKEGILEATKDMSEPKFLIGVDCCLRFLAIGDNMPKFVETYRDNVGKDVPRLVMGSGGEIFGTHPNSYFFNNFSQVTFAGGE